ncbi:unnamed protein product [Adineta ricciae]|uniref:Uncharacterized protein n=1 Tax=Adineta ricciae TaxID=249248 RepID=A0A815Z8Q3_ADIRI|nr:unnamed protein product [Adineta ricciae]CAF1581231.1 unnamed protein product [Adineta ricciae]
MHRAIVYVYVLLLIAIYTNAFPKDPAINEIQRLEEAAARNVHISEQDMIMLNSDRSGNQDRNIAAFNLIASRVNPSERSLVDQITLLAGINQPPKTTA